MIADNLDSIMVVSSTTHDPSEEEIERMLAEGNIEANGDINYDSFVKLITSE